MQSLFKAGSKINQDHKHKYIHILAYAASVVETWKKVQRYWSIMLNKLETQSLVGCSTKFNCQLKLKTAIR